MARLEFNNCVLYLSFTLGLSSNFNRGSRSPKDTVVLPSSLLNKARFTGVVSILDTDFNILINTTKMEYLEKVGLDSGFRKFQALAFDKIQLPTNHTLRPNIENINLANQARGIS